MPLVAVNSTEVRLIKRDPRRKWVSFTVKTAAKDVFISDIPGITSTIYKWVIQKGDMLIITREFGFPESAFYAKSDGSTQVIVGFQNEEKQKV